MGLLRPPPTRARPAGYSLIEIAVALALGGLVALLIAAVFAGGLAAWRRARDLREAQSEAAVVADAIAREVRVSSRAALHRPPDPPPTEGVPVLVLARRGRDREDEVILFTFIPAQGMVRRLVLHPGDAGTPTLAASQVVSRRVRHLTVEPIDGGVVVEVEVAVGAASGRTRTAALAQNP
jgi:hypothetical protein